MKKFQAVLVASLCVLVAGGAMGAPRGGSWSTDAGDFDAGVWQEVFYGSGEGQPGNVISAEGAEWYLVDATLDSHEWISQGPTVHMHKTIYKDGQLMLEDGPWAADGDTLPYVVNLGDLTVYTTKVFDPNSGDLVSLTWTMEACGMTEEDDDREIVISASYSGLPTPIEVDGVAGMTDDIDSAEICVILFADVDIDPDTLNLKSKGRWITCYIQLPADADVGDIDVDSILLNDSIPAVRYDIQDGDVLMVKFDRSEVQEIVEPGTVELTVTGMLTDGTEFEGSDEIRVIDPPAEKPNPKAKPPKARSFRKR